MLAIELHARLWTALSNKPPVIFDVGANRGQTSAAYLVALPGAQITAFEPNPALAAELRAVVSTVHSVAVGASDGTVTFRLNNADTTSSVLAADQRLVELSDDYQTTEEITVPCVKLDGFGTPDILKIDTQGWDLEVLRGTTESLARGIPIVSCEVYFATAYEGQAPFHTIAGFLDEQGYHFHSFSRIVDTAAGYHYFGDATWLSSEAWDQLGFL